MTTATTRARRLRRWADGLRGQIDFVAQTPTSAGLTANQTAMATIRDLRTRADALDAMADDLDPQRVTVGR